MFLLLCFPFTYSLVFLFEIGFCYFVLLSCSQYFLIERMLHCLYASIFFFCYVVVLYAVAFVQLCVLHHIHKRYVVFERKFRNICIVAGECILSLPEFSLALNSTAFSTYFEFVFLFFFCYQFPATAIRIPI